VYLSTKFSHLKLVGFYGKDAALAIIPQQLGTSPPRLNTSPAIILKGHNSTPTSSTFSCSMMKAKQGSTRSSLPYNLYATSMNTDDVVIHYAQPNVKYFTLCQGNGLSGSSILSLARHCKNLEMLKLSCNFTCERLSMVHGKKFSSMDEKQFYPVFRPSLRIKPSVLQFRNRGV